MTDAGGLLEDHDAGAMTVAVPGTQQGPGRHPSRPQRVAGLLFQVLRVVVHSHVVACIPAESSIAVSNQELLCGVVQSNIVLPSFESELVLCELTRSPGRDAVFEVQDCSIICLLRTYQTNKRSRSY